MEKLLNTLANGLSIRFKKSEDYEGEGLNVTFQSFDYRPVTKEVQELFKSKFKEHLFAKLKELESPGNFVEYSFKHGVVYPMSSLLDTANDNMAEVLLQLPALEAGESYNLPENTFVSFRLLEKNGDNITVAIKPLCSWTKNSYDQ